MARRGGEKLLSHRIEAIEYTHAADGLPYRHDFERGDSAILLEQDGGVRIKSESGARLWDDFTVGGRSQRFLVNPRGRRDSMATKKKRKPPAGFTSWKSYMASIRPGAKAKRRLTRRTAASTRSENPVAKKRKSTRRRKNPASNPPRRARRRVHARRRRNPAGVSLRNITNTAIDGALHGGLVVAGGGAARLVRGRLGYLDGSVVSSAVEVGIGLAMGVFGARFIGADKARSLMHGAFAGAIRAAARTVAPNNALLSEALGATGPTDSQVVYLPADASPEVRRLAGLSFDEAGAGMGAYNGATSPQFYQ